MTCNGEVPRMGDLEEMCESGHTKPYNVKTITLDDLKIKPDEKVMIKLDVEGSEVKVLEGCPKLLANPNVDWFVDIHFCYGVPKEKVFPFFKHKYMRDHGMDNNNAVREFYGNK